MQAGLQTVEPQHMVDRLQLLLAGHHLTQA